MKIRIFSTFAVMFVSIFSCDFTKPVTSGDSQVNSETLVVKIAASPTSPSILQPVTISGAESSATSGVESFSWSIQNLPVDSFVNHDGTLVTNSNALSFIPDEPGNYTVNLEITSKSGNKKSNQYILVVQNPNVGSGGGNATVIDVPFTTQYPPGTSFKNSLNCGPASVLMVYAYFKNLGSISSSYASDYISAEDDWLYSNLLLPKNSYNGSVTDDVALKRLLTEFKPNGESQVIASSATFRSDISISDIKNYINSNTPIIALTTLFNGHWLVIKGISDTTITVNDPGKTQGADKTYSIGAFQNVWQNKGIVVQKNPSLVQLLSPAPTITVSQGSYRDRIQIIVGHVPNATGYYIQYSTSSTLASGVTTVTLGDLYPSDNILNDQNVTPAVIYYYRAQAYQRDQNGNIISLSSWGPIASGYRGN